MARGDDAMRVSAPSDLAIRPAATMRRSMRILMLAQSYAPVVGGEERIVEDLSVELARRGHDVAVATLRQPAGEPPVAVAGVEIHLLDGSLPHLPGISVDPERQYAPPGPDPLTVHGLHGVLADFRPDVVHGHNWLADSYLPLDRSSGPAFVLSLHDYSLVCATKRFFYRGGVCTGPEARKCLAHSVAHYGAAKGAMTAAGAAASGRWLRRRVDMFLPVSEAVRDLSGLGPGEPHRVIPNFVGELPEAPADQDRLRELPPEPFLLYFGDVTKDKGVAALVEAYDGMADAPPLVLIGRQLIDDLPRLPGLHQLPPLPHALAIEAVRRSAFVVVPSLLPESFGIVALEAAAAGKPTVASNIGGLRDIVVDGETGLLFEAGNVGALRTALERLCRDGALRERMGEAASRQARRFAPEAVVPEFEAAYREAADARLKKRARRRR
jgi:glycosyltransferase involved in cell wall biosynthesis